MVASASPCSMPSRTQCCKWPSSTIWPTRCRAPLTALIWMRMSSQGTSLSIIWSMACNWPMSFLIRRCRFSASMHCRIRPPFRAGDIIAGRLSRGGRIRGRGMLRLPTCCDVPAVRIPRPPAAAMRLGRGASGMAFFPSWPPPGLFLPLCVREPEGLHGRLRPGVARRHLHPPGAPGDKSRACPERMAAGTGRVHHREGRQGASVVPAGFGVGWQCCAPWRRAFWGDLKVPVMAGHMSAFFSFFDARHG